METGKGMWLAPQEIKGNSLKSSNTAFVFYLLSSPFISHYLLSTRFLIKEQKHTTLQDVANGVAKGALSGAEMPSFSLQKDTFCNAGGIILIFKRL